LHDISFTWVSLSKHGITWLLLLLDTNKTFHLLHHRIAIVRLWYLIVKRFVMDRVQ
jgi:hypothetical protein